MKFFSLSVLFSVLIFTAASADSSFTSILEKDGSFLNRIRWEGRTFTFSLTGSADEGGLYAEPTLKSNEFIFGRLNLKSVLREIYGSGGSAAGAAVYYEPGSLTATDSFSGSSRFGAALFPPASNDLSSWIFRANNGRFSGGIVMQKLSPRSLPDGIQLETDLLLCAGNTVDNLTDQWFGEKQLMQVQPVLNAAVETRLHAGNPGTSGRSMLKASTEGFSASLSALAACSLPFYTEAGISLRLFGLMGCADVNICGSLQFADENYLSANGSLLDNHLSAGVSVFCRPAADICICEFTADFSREQKRADIVPSRYIPQSDKMSAELKLFAGITELKVNGDCNWSYDSLGGISHSFSAGAACELSAGLLLFRLDYGCCYEGINRYWELPLHKLSTDVVIKTDGMKLSLGAGIMDGAGFEAGIEFSPGDADVSFELEIDEERDISFSIGFETCW
ncbi:MAG TPA: hypothetical protein DCO79_15350 [Spirochaeta sp.]|nr:hypothetical protein [Spirochaeta sp.]